MATAAYPSNLATIPNFDPYIDVENISSRWKSWLARFENFLVAIDIKEIERKKALLLYHAGEHVFAIYQRLSTKTNDQDDYDTMKKMLNIHFNQHEVDSSKIDDQKKDIKVREKNEKFLDKIAEKLADKIGEASLKEAHKAKQERMEKWKNSPYSCKSCGRKKHSEGEICPAIGKICGKCNKPNHFANMCNEEAAVDVIQNSSETKKADRNRNKNYNNNKFGIYNQAGCKCQNCGQPPHNEKLDKCPAKGKICSKCDKHNHFANVCEKNCKNSFETSSDDKRIEKGDGHEKVTKKYERPNNCYGCGKRAHIDGEICSAKGKVCFKCNTSNHLAHMCRSKPTEPEIKSMTYANVCEKNYENSFETSSDDKKIEKGASHEKVTKKYERPNNCYSCGKRAHIDGEICSAKGKVCFKCNKSNHLAHMCRSKPAEPEIKSMTKAQMTAKYVDDLQFQNQMPSAPPKIHTYRGSQLMTHSSPPGDYPSHKDHLLEYKEQERRQNVQQQLYANKMQQLQQRQQTKPNFTEEEGCTIL
jgi:hypothetical protein